MGRNHKQISRFLCGITSVPCAGTQRVILGVRAIVTLSENGLLFHRTKISILFIVISMEQNQGRTF